jgi:hypothetical protein
VINAEAGEATVMTYKTDNTLDLRGGWEHPINVKVFGSVDQMCCGDEHFAYITDTGQVFHCGGLFSKENPNTLLFLKEREGDMKLSTGFFDYKVLGLWGKYSYFAAIQAS